MTIECAFGIASTKFRILHKAIETKVENADHIVNVVCILHNIIIDKEKEFSLRKSSTTENLNTDLESNNIMRLRANRTNRASRTVIDNRNIFVEFFKNNKM